MHKTARRSNPIEKGGGFEKSLQFFQMKNGGQFQIDCLRDHECYIILIEQNMKKVEIDGKKLIIYEDGSIRIPYKDMQLCLDLMDIAFLYNESMIALNARETQEKQEKKSMIDSSKKLDFSIEFVNQD